MDAPTDLQPFPVTRFIYYGDHRYYYAYGNTPAEDFLENITEIKTPTVLLLGCGDIRSCFYTLWKNFDPQHKRHFNGVHFVLNDCSAAVLARNILFLYLCLQMPSKKEDTKKWVASLWSIWYCHQLLPEHEIVLRGALKTLMRWSGSAQSWSEMTANPLRRMVHFASPSTLHQIRYYWEAWYHRRIDPASIQALRAMRKAQYIQQLRGQADNVSASITNTSLGLLGPSFSSQMFGAMQKEIKIYLDSGNAFAESVLDLPAPTEKCVINPTFFERSDGRYTLHYLSEPYNCFFQTVVFSPKELKKMGTPKSLLNQLIVDDESFESQLTLSNSVQQFFLCLSSAAAILERASSHPIPHVSFTFQSCDALEFCQFLRHNACEFTTCTGFEPVFDLVHSSNLIDHLSPPNLVLSVAPLLRENGYLLTTSMLYKTIAATAESYLQACFGFESKLLPLVCGIRCMGHEGRYASPVSPQPVSCSLGSVGLATLSSKLLIWQRVSTPPLRLASLDSGSAVAILRALNSAISVAVGSFFASSGGLRTTGHLNTGTVIQLLQCFVTQLASDVGCTDYRFWEPLCATLRDRVDIKPFMISLQTQAILHGVHLHLTVSRHDCPLCTQKPLTDTISQFSIAFEVLPAVPDTVSTPAFVLFLHRASCTDLLQMLLSSGNEMHIIDCLAGSELGSKLKLDFFVPPSFAEDGYHMTAASFVLAQAGTMPFNMPTMVMQGKLADFRATQITYCFQQLQSRLAATESAFGKVTQHSGDGDRFETVVSLSGATVSALEKQNIDLRRISDSEIEVSCGNYSIRISYPHPVHYSNTSVKLSRKRKMVTVEVPRKAHQYFEEMPLFVANPDNKLSLPPVSIGLKLCTTFCAMQFTDKDREIMKECDRDIAVMPAEVNLKETVNALFQFESCDFIHLSFSSSGVHGLLVIHSRIFDQQNRSPAIDLSFCFLEMSFLYQVAPQWQEMTPDKIRNIIVNEEEYDLLKKVFHHFARRTVTTSRKPYGCMPLLIKHKIDRYFTRAVIYPLYTDPDAFVETMGFTKGVNAPHMSTAVTNPPDRTQAVKEIGSKMKCSFCGTQSDELKKCGRCGKAQYCRQECQKQHWKVHKQICASQSAAPPDARVREVPRPPAASVTTFQEKLGASSTKRSKRKCSFCGSQPDVVKQCSRCGEAQYCGPSCQKKHWKEHKLTCNPKSEAHPSVRDESLHSPPNVAQKIDHDKCEGCEKEFSSLRKCRCHQVAYCSVECQRKDWQKHKDVCSAKKQV